LRQLSPDPTVFGKSGGIAQLVERLVRNEKARGSNPLTSTNQNQTIVVSNSFKKFSIFFDFRSTAAETA
jgi:hypothetical protein